MPVLAVPEHSQLLMIEPIPRHLQKFNTTLAKQISEQLCRLSHAADIAGIPRYFAISQRDDGPEEFLSKPCDKNKPRVFKFERDRPVWSNTEMVLSMQKEDREQLFICGFWLDDVVMAAALEAQPLGFNTHVIVDLTLPYNVEGRQAALDRLNQYCVAPISFQNLLYEWMAKTEDNDRRKDLETLWEEQRSCD